MAGRQIYPFESLVEMKASHAYDEGIDKHLLEEYLAPLEFGRVFGTSFADFKRMPKWKRDNKKKELKLF